MRHVRLIVLHNIDATNDHASLFLIGFELSLYEILNGGPV